jgi:rhodanese-related sulfurtransferase
MSRAGIEGVLAAAQARILRFDAERAFTAQQLGAVLVDIRPESNRIAEGEIPGAVVIDRNVLEWRLDPASPDRVDWTSYDTTIVLVCNEGYASSLAAATLQDIGLTRAGDLIGGFRAWRAAGLPTVGGEQPSPPIA